MRWRGWFVLVGLGALLIALHQLIGAIRLPVASVITTEIGVLGIVLLFLGLLVWLIERYRERSAEPPVRLLARGAMLGLVAGLIVAVLFPDKGAADNLTAFYRYQRLLGFAALLGGGLYVIMHFVAYNSSTRTVSRLEQVLGMATGFIAVLMLGLSLAIYLPEIGSFVCRRTIGVLSLVGLGEAGCTHAFLRPRDDILPVAAAMLAVYFTLLAIYENRRWRLSFARWFIVVGGTLVAGFVLYEIVSHLHRDPSQRSGVDNLVNFGPFVVGLGLFGALFSFWVTWSKHQSLIEALCNAFASTDGFRHMVESRLKDRFDVPDRASSLCKDVGQVVDRAEANGWIGNLLVHARRSRPDDVRLAELADRMGVGIDPPSEENLRAAVAAVTGKKPEEVKGMPTAQLEKAILAFSTLEPSDRRRKEAQLEGRVCQVMFKSIPEVGTGWLVGPDLVLTNYHVVESILPRGRGPADWPSSKPRNRLRATDVVCQFDYKRVGGILIQGTSVGLHPEQPVVAWSPFSSADQGENLSSVPAENELDFALLRLDRRVGELPIGEGESQAPARGWISLRSAIDAPDIVGTTDETRPLLYVLQHPHGLPLKAECGIAFAMNGNGTRVRHQVSTERGSSGSPCFNYADLEPVALHHAGWHSRTLKKTFNQAVPLSSIIRHLQALRGQFPDEIEAFWDMAPPEPGGGNYQKLPPKPVT